MEPTLNFVVFTYNGNAEGGEPTTRIFRLMQLTSMQLTSKLAEMTRENFAVNGVSQIPDDVQNCKFLVTDGDAYWSYIYEVPEWKDRK